jgi:putative phosphoesterase
VRLALMSDVHGNLPALRSALELAARYEAQRLVVAGDLVGDGPHPVEVVRELRQRSVVAIRGNVDRKVLEEGERRGALEARLVTAREQRRNRVWSALRLLDAPDERSWLSDLPEQTTLELGGRQVLVVHGSPRGDTDYVYPSLTPVGLAAKLEPLQGGRPDLLVCGHSHIPFAREVDGVWVVNCGSVGRPADGDPRGSLALADVGTAGVRAQILRFSYDVDALTAALGERGTPGIDPEEYRRGVKR